MRSTFELDSFVILGIGMLVTGLTLPLVKHVSYIAIIGVALGIALMAIGIIRILLLHRDNWRSKRYYEEIARRSRTEETGSQTDIAQSTWQLDEATAKQIADDFLTAEGAVYRNYYSMIKHEDFEQSPFVDVINPRLTATRVWEFGVSFIDSKYEDPTMVCGGSALVFVDDLTKQCGIFYRL